MKYGLLSIVYEDLKAYITGSSPLPYIEYNETGNWTAWLPKYEPQADKFESVGCTLWGGQNQIEILYKFLYGVEPNYDEWFNYPLIPIKDNGQDPHVTYESIRATGLVDSGTVKTPSNRKEALDLNRITGSMRAKGQNWLVKHIFKHEWLWEVKPQNFKEIMKEALKTSPLGISVTAWKKVDGVYVSNAGGNNHWCVAYMIADYRNYKDCVYAFDTYDHSIKILHPDHNIRRAKRIWLMRTDLQGIKQHISILQRVLNRLLMKQTLLDICTANLGKDVSPKDLAPDSLGCAESVTNLLKQKYPETPIITGTITLYEYLKNAKNRWKETATPVPEAVVISHTGSGNGSVRGHTGILDENLNIMSNDSRTGKWITNYSLDTWRKRYVIGGGMKMRFFVRA